MPTTLKLILVLLAAAVVVVVVCRLIRLPAILGYLLVGIAVGPHGFGWVPDDTDTRELAEFGIVFLMFSIGLEFSLSHLRSMQRAVFGLGLAQVAITTAAAVAALHLLGYGWKAGLVLGGALAMSSTAIVSKMLAERMELNTPHGRDSLAILLFQDLAVVAFLIVIPSLGKAGEDMALALGLAAVKAIAALTLILYFGQKPMRAWFHVVARQRSPELFVLNVLLVTLGLGALTATLGLSLALGAFLAGMLIAETEFRYQVDDDIKPFRDVLLGLFFVTVGMVLDIKVVAANAGLVALLLLIPVFAKFALDRRAGPSVRLAVVRGAAHRVLSRAGRRTGAGDAGAGHGQQAGAQGTRAAGPGGDDPVHAVRAADHPVCGADRAQADGQRLAGARGAAHADRRQDDDAAGPHHRLRLRSQRPEPRAPARGRGHSVRRAGFRSRARARGGGGRRRGRLWRRQPARGADVGRHGQGQGGRDHVRRYSRSRSRSFTSCRNCARNFRSSCGRWTTANSRS